MKYTAIELEYSDIMWFGIDKNRYIAAFTSGGIAYVPEFVCQSKEETELLEDFFTNQLNASTQYLLCVVDENNALVQDCKRLSERGLYYFDMSEKSGVDYDLMSYPLDPLKLEMLPSHIVDILQSHMVNFDFANSKSIKIPR